MKLKIVINIEFYHEKTALKMENIYRDINPLKILHILCKFQHTRKVNKKINIWGLVPLIANRNITKPTAWDTEQ